jgi:hypothetical protein
MDKIELQRKCNLVADVLWFLLGVKHNNDNCPLNDGHIDALRLAKNIFQDAINECE